MKRKKSDQYLKVVEWSAEDHCYVGTAPGLLLGGVHGNNQSRVFAQLCDAVEEAIHIFEKDGKPLPAPTANRTYSGKILLRVSSSLHRALAIRAMQLGESVNKLIQQELEACMT